LEASQNGGILGVGVKRLVIWFMFELNRNTPDKQQCKGLFWKASTNAYFDYLTGNMVDTKRLTLLKKKSCKGCDSCSWFLDFMHEDVLNGAHDYSEKYLNNLEHGAIYTYKIHSSTDFESGISEIDEVEFVKLDAI